MILTVLLSVLLLPDKAAALLPTVYYDVWVGGVQVTDDNKDNIPVESGSATFDPATNTLTLNNATIEDDRFPGSIYDTVGIHSKAGLNLHLIGENTVKNVHSSQFAYGIACGLIRDTGDTGNPYSWAEEGKLTVTAAEGAEGGSLDVTVKRGNYCYGIFSQGFTLKSGTVTVAIIDEDARESEGLRNIKAPFIVENGNLSATAGTGQTSYGIHLSYGADLEMKGGTLTATAGEASDNNSSAGIRAATSSITMTGGTLEAVGGTGGTPSFGILSYDGDTPYPFTISGGTATFRGTYQGTNKSPDISGYISGTYFVTVDDNVAGSSPSFWNGGPPPLNAQTLEYVKIQPGSPATVSFAAGDTGASGSMDDVIIPKDSSYTLPECGFTAPTGKIFKAWSVDGTEVGQPGESITVSGNTTLTALWATPCTVTFEADGGTPVPAPQTVARGNTAKEPTAPTKEGHDFQWWYKDDPETAFDFDTQIETDTELKAAWKVKTYEVTFDANGGTPVPETQTVDHGDTVEKPTDPTKENYKFLGWYEGNSETAFDFATPIKADTELTAKWNEFHTVTFDANGEGGDPTIQTQEVAHGETLNMELISEPTREGYDFQWWYKDDSQTAFDFTTEITEDITLKAKWELKTYEVTFNADNGSDPAIETVDHGDTVDEPEPPTKENYEFLGWYDNAGKEFDFATPIKADTGLTARWKQVKFSVSGYVWYDDGDGLHDGSRLGGVPGVYVKIMDADGRRLAWTKTDADGRYSLPYFEAGTYTIQFYNIPRGCRIAPSFVGDDRTVDSDGLKRTVTLTEDLEHHDLGLLKQSVRSTRR